MRKSCEVLEGHKGTVTCAFELIMKPGKERDDSFGTYSYPLTSSAPTNSNTDRNSTNANSGLQNNNNKNQSLTSSALLLLQRLDDIGVSSGESNPHQTHSQSSLLSHLHGNDNDTTTSTATPGTSMSALQAAFSQDHHRYQPFGTIVTTGSADGTVRLWVAPAVAHYRQQSGWKCSQTLEGHGGTITSITGAPGIIITGSTDRHVKV